jgi:hypothetical protein
MSGKKSQIKHIMRAHVPQAHLLIKKNWKAGKTTLVPGRLAADGTILAEARHLVIDVSIYSHMFTNVVSSPTNWREKVYVRKLGTEFVEELSKNVVQAFLEGYKIVVIAMDKQWHTTAAKENTQSKRVTTTLSECSALGVPPLNWHLDNPTAIIADDQEIPPMCAIKATPAAFRYMQYQAVMILKETFVAPPGCRLIIDNQPYSGTNPATPDEWLVDPQIVVRESERPMVERLREQLRQTDKSQWRHAARKLSTELGRAGACYTLPWCVETTPSGVRIKPYVLRNWQNTWGEADLAVWGANARLLADAKRDSLQSDERYTYDGRKYESTDLDDKRDEAVMTGRTVVATTDSDFISGSLAAVAAAICDFAHGKPPTYETIDAVGAHCPLVLMGDTYATELGYVRDATNYGKESETKQPGGRVLLKVFEFIDTHRLFCALLFNRFPGPSPANTLPPLKIGESTPHEWFRRALTIVTFCAIAGNDFLKGLGGMSHEPMWTALTQFTALRGGELVLLSRAFMRPLDSERGALPSQSAVLLNPSAYTQFIKHCHHVNMVSKGGTFAPHVPANQMTYDQLAYAVASKEKKRDNYHMPNTQTLTLMYERTLWSLYYTLYGPVTVRRTLDETLVGWRAGRERTLIV